MARTAVIAGTAGAVSRRMDDRAGARGTQQASAEAYHAQEAHFAQQQQMQQLLAQQQPTQAVAPATETMSQLQQLGDMRSAGLLTDAEFSAAKAKVLG
ncbi:SHOCT domain-containing protein [Isoptericola sediminis]|nr:SHOCT domain-containing protein [Isoptericola sediminis]